jgi:hypothetical protein
MTKFMADCVIVCFFSICFVLSVSFVYLSVSICHSASFGFYGGAPGGGAPGGSAPGERSFVLYIRGVDRLGEKDKHFYLSSLVPFHCEYTFYQSDHRGWPEYLSIYIKASLKVCYFLMLRFSLSLAFLGSLIADWNPHRDKGRRFSICPESDGTGMV